MKHRRILLCVSFESEAPGDSLCVSFESEAPEDSLCVSGASDLKDTQTGVSVESEAPWDSLSVSFEDSPVLQTQKRRRLIAYHGS